MAQWFSFSTHQYASFKPKRVLKKQVDTVGKNYGNFGRAVTDPRIGRFRRNSNLQHETASKHHHQQQM